MHLHDEFPSTEVNPALSDCLLLGETGEFPQFSAILSGYQDDGFGMYVEAPYITCLFVSYYMFLVEH